MVDYLIDDDMFEPNEDEAALEAELVRQPKQCSSMRRIEELLEQKKLLRDLDDYADDEPVNFTPFHGDVDAD
jgi:hypothetical protein